MESKKLNKTDRDIVDEDEEEIDEDDEIEEDVEDEDENEEESEEIDDDDEIAYCSENNEDEENSVDSNDKLESDLDDDFNDKSNNFQNINPSIDVDEENNNNDDSIINPNYLQKINNEKKNEIIREYYPELLTKTYAEINKLCTVTRNNEGTIIDDNHKSLPFITKYEKARIIGERAMQLNEGVMPTVSIDDDIIDGYHIANEEYLQKKIPFIIKRPMPNGSCEYWKLSDLEILW